MKRLVLFALAVATVFVAAVTVVVRSRREASEASEEERVVSERPLDTMTRDELYEVARELDIPGRSKMKKPELKDAISRAERSG
jgi:hypothetical protein